MSDYILLDLPYYSNVGDVLIWQSTLDVLKDLPYKCLYSSSIETYIKPKIKENILIVFLGGGNFGDLWERHQLFRYRVMNDFPNNPVLQLPQSVCFESDEKMKRDIAFFSNHKGKITICLRDKKSYETVTNFYKNVEAVLLPDLALSFDLKGFCKKNNIDTQNGSGNLLVLRNDKEKTTVRAKSLPNMTKVGDWPSIEYDLPEMRRYFEIDRYMCKYHIPLSLRNKFTDFYFKWRIKNAIIISGIRFLSLFANVYSTRLHAAILSSLLGKKTYIIDNSYGKNSGVFELWMSDLKNVSMI